MIINPKRFRLNPLRTQKRDHNLNNHPNPKPCALPRGVDQVQRLLGEHEDARSPGFWVFRVQVSRV